MNMSGINTSVSLTFKFLNINISSGKIKSKYWSIDGIWFNWILFTLKSKVCNFICQVVSYSYTYNWIITHIFFNMNYKLYDELCISIRNFSEKLYPSNLELWRRSTYDYQIYLICLYHLKSYFIVFSRYL